MPRIILFRGKPGVGKTTLSNAVSKRLGIAVIRKDDIYDALAEFVGEHSVRNDICQQTMFRILSTNIQNGVDTIVDHSLHYPNPIRDFQDWVHKQEADLVSILLTCSDEEVWKQRFNQRKFNPKPNNLITDFDELKAHYGSLYTEPIEGELVVDSLGDLDALTRQVLQFLKIDMHKSPQNESYKYEE